MPIVLLERGDVLIWRGDLVHCGNEYRADNVRLFNYVLPPGYTEPRDASGALVYNTRAIEFIPPTPPIPPSSPLTRTTRAHTNLHPRIDMVKLDSDGHLHITDFIRMPNDLFAILVRSLTQNDVSLFTQESAEIFNQQRDGENDGRRRMTDLSAWLAATGSHPEAPHLIQRLQAAVARIIAALPAGYGPRDLPTEIRIIRSAAGCLQQEAHTDYHTGHIDFGDFDTPPLSLFFAISPGAKLVLWDRSTRTSSPQARTIEFNQGEAILLLGSKTHSGAAYDQENFRGFMYIHKPTYFPPNPRVTYAPRAACPRRPQPATGKLPEPGEHTKPHGPCEPIDSDSGSTD